MAKCPRCGAEVQPEKTWQVVSPLPDAYGRITITVLGTFKCSSCGYGWKGRVSSIKVGPEGEVSFKEGGRKGGKGEGRPPERREGKVIEVDISDILEE
ncbi:MAG: chromatin protein Cren7 [Zestosphaera sp.]